MRIGIDLHGAGGDALSSGNVRHFTNLISAILDLDKFHQYHLLASNPGSLSALAKAHPNAEIGTLWPRTQWMQRPISAPLYALRKKLDLVHFPFIRPPLSSVRTIVTVHDVLFETMPEHYTRSERLRMQLLVPWSCRNADRVFTVSGYCRQAIHNHYSIPLNRIVVTYNAADEFSLPDVSLPSSLPVPDRYFCFVGTLQPRKNVARLVQAFDLFVQRTRLPHHLVLAGAKGWKNQELETTLERSRSSTRVHVTGFVSEQDRIHLMRRADALVFPSLAEGFALPPIEAQSLGTPVIVSNNTCFPEIYRDSAAYCDACDVDSIADAMAQVALNPDHASELKLRGIANAKRFSWRATAATALNAYCEVLGTSLPESLATEPQTQIGAAQ